MHVQARRALGQNARPRDGQPGSGLEWFDTSGLCDPSRADMDCPGAPGDPAAAGFEPSEPGTAAAAGGDARDGGGGDAAGKGAGGADGEADPAADGTRAGGMRTAAPAPALRLRDGLALIPRPAD